MGPNVILEGTSVDDFIARIEERNKAAIAEARKQTDEPTDFPMDYFLGKIPNCKDPKTFRKRVRELNVKPSRVIGNMPLYFPSSFNLR